MATVNSVSLRSNILAMAIAHPELPRLWGSKPAVDIGQGWKLLHFQHYAEPLWVTIVAPDGVEFETWIEPRCSGSWKTQKHDWREIEPGEGDVMVVDSATSVHTCQEAEEALARLLARFQKV